MTTPALTTRSPVATGTWTVDISVSSATFRLRTFFGFRKVTGQIPIASGTVIVADLVPLVKVAVVFETPGLNTGNANRDRRLRDRLGEVPGGPRPSFRAYGVAPTRTGKWRADGDLTISANTAPMKVDARLVDVKEDKLALAVSGTLHLREFGVPRMRRIAGDRVDVIAIMQLRRDAAY